MHLMVGLDGMVHAAGKFVLVGAETRRGLAAMDLDDGSLTAWNPDPRREAGQPTVSALTVRSDGTVYVAGCFTTIGANDAARDSLAALDPITGNATGWNPGQPGLIRSMLLSPDESILYAAGGFTRIGANDEPRNKIAALSTTTGDATIWDPNPSQPLLSTALTTVHAIAFGADNTLYVGGEFAAIGGQSRSNLAQVSLAGAGAATAWNPNVHGPSVDGYDGVRAIAVAPSPDRTVYVGGGFTTAGTDGASRANLAGIDPVSGNATAWDPGADWSVFALAAGADGTIYVGGQFDSAGGGNSYGLGALDPQTGAALEWAPLPNFYVQTIVVGPGEQLYAGGAFTTLDDGVQQGLASFSAAPAAPVNTGAPQISGTPAVGETLRCWPGSWSNSPRYYTYEWLRDGVALWDPAPTKHVVSDPDAGHELSCRVTATNAGGATSADSAAVSVPGGQSASDTGSDSGSGAEGGSPDPGPGPGPRWETGIPGPPTGSSGAGGGETTTDTSAERPAQSPLVSLAAPRRISWRYFVTHGLRVRIHCLQACGLRARLLLPASSNGSVAAKAPRLLGRGSGSLPTGGRRIVRLKPVRIGVRPRAALGRLTVRISDQSGHVWRTSRNVRLGR